MSSIFINQTPTIFIGIPLKSHQKNSAILAFIFSHLLIITPILVLMSTKICKEHSSCVTESKGESRKGIGKLYYVLRHIEQKILSVPFFFLSLTSNFNFFRDGFSFFLHVMLTLRIYVYFFGE